MAFDKAALVGEPAVPCNLQSAAAGISAGRMLAVDRPVQDPGAGRFSCPAGPDKQVRVGEMPGSHLEFEGISYLILSHDLVKGLRAPFSVQCLIHAAPLS